MARKEELSLRKIEFFSRVFYNKKSLKFLIAFADEDKLMSYQEMRKNTGVRDGADKVLHILGLIDKRKSEDGIMMIGLTPRGREFAKALKKCFDIMDDILPGV